MVSVVHHFFNIFQFDSIESIIEMISIHTNTIHSNTMCTWIVRWKRLTIFVGNTNQRIHQRRFPFLICCNRKFYLSIDSNTNWYFSFEFPMDLHTFLRSLKKSRQYRNGVSLKKRARIGWQSTLPMQKRFKMLLTAEY